MSEMAIDIGPGGNGPLSPRANPDLIGHEAQEQLLLKTLLDSGRMAHAWLINGPRGIGKATLAYRFARYLLASGAAGGKGPGLFGNMLPMAGDDGLFVDPDSPVFNRVAASSHADLLSIERTENDRGKLRTEIVVNDIRSITSFLNLTAAEGGWRVVVIDSADEMNRNAANAVLKVLEEPPDYALLLLVSHNPGLLLPTIRSRCRPLALSPLSNDAVTTMLRRNFLDLSQADAALLAHLADGSIGRAIDLAGEGGLEIYRELISLLKTLPELDAVRLHDFGSRLAKTGADQAFRTGTELLTWWLGRLIRTLCATNAVGGPALDEAERAEFTRLGRAATLDRWFQVWEKITRLLARTSSANLDRKQVVLNVLLALEDTVRR